MLEVRLLDSVLLWLPLTFVSGFRLNLMYHISSFTHLYVFQLCVLLPQRIQTTSIVWTSRINLLHLRWSSVRLVIFAKGFLKLPNLLTLVKQNSQSLPRNFEFLSSCDFWQTANIVLNKSVISPQFNGPGLLSSASDRTKLYTENFSKSSNR